MGIDPATAAAAAASLGQLEPPNRSPHILLPGGNKSVTSGADANGSTYAVHTNGASLITEAGAMGGFLAIAGVIGFAVTLWGAYLAIKTDLSFGVWWPCIALLGVALGMLRTDLIGHRQSPILFDRAARQVHVFVSDTPAWWQLWRWWARGRVDSFDWACIRAEVVEFVQVGATAVPRQDYALQLAVVEAPGSLRVRARFGVGLGFPWSPEPSLRLWEHLRRYMNENGPPLAAGDTIFADATEEGFWRSLGFMQPLLMPGARGWITGEDFSGNWWFSLPFSIAFLAMLWFTVPCGLIRWLALKARREPRWPPEILASVGPVVDLTAPRQTWTQRRKAMKNAKKQREKQG